MVGGLPKESTEEKYWDSMDGEELPREPLSRSPGNPWYISPEGPRGNVTPSASRESARSPATTWHVHNTKLISLHRFVLKSLLYDRNTSWNIQPARLIHWSLSNTAIKSSLLAGWCVTVFCKSDVKR